MASGPDQPESEREPVVRPAPGRRRRRWWIAAVAVPVVLAAAVAYGGWFGSDQAIRPVRWGNENVMVYAAADGTVTLAALPETRRRGTYWLVWGGAATMIGDIVRTAPGRVTRTILGGHVPSAGTRGSITAAPPADPKVDFGLDFSEFDVPTELGPAPAWYVPGVGSTWVVAVHGQNGRRKATLKALPVAHRLGMPFLAITYRNDEGAPASPDGLIHLGDSEWRDLEAAVRAARDRGARRVVLYGTSMGGGIVGQFLARSPLAAMVSAAVLDAPTSDLERVGEQGARRFNLPAVAGWTANRVVEWRTGIDVDRLNLVTHPPAVKPPTLLLQGDADEEVPVQVSRDLAAAGKRVNWRIRYEEFAGAGHTESWNADRARYDRVLADFLTPFAVAG